MLGFDPATIPTLAEAGRPGDSPRVEYDGIDIQSLRGSVPNLRFAPPAG
jgi:hypothetical protein